MNWTAARSLPRILDALKQALAGDIRGCWVGESVPTGVARFEADELLVRPWSIAKALGIDLHRFDVMVLPNLELVQGGFIRLSSFMDWAAAQGLMIPSDPVIQ